MTNHPNRGVRTPASRPTPQEIAAARRNAGHTQEQAAEVVYGTRRAWQDWELGHRGMPPAALELYRLKTGQAVLEFKDVNPAGGPLYRALLVQNGAGAWVAVEQPDTAAPD